MSSLAASVQGLQVTADLFVETLKQGDRILLCSDGLHGYVDEREIKREMIQLADPEERRTGAG